MYILYMYINWELTIRNSVIVSSSLETLENMNKCHDPPPLGAPLPWVPLQEDMIVDATSSVSP